MAEATTWDTAIGASIAPPADTGAEGSDTPEAVVPTPEAPAESTSDTPTESVVAPSDDAEKVGEEKPEAEEQPEEDDEEKDDPEELKAFPSKSAARRAARQERVRRLEAESQVVQSFLDPEKPIGTVAETLEARSPSRYHELVDDFFENHGDQYLQKRYGLKAEEVDAIVNSREERPAPDPDYDPLADPLISDQFKDELKELRGIKDEFGQVKSKVEGFETKEQERERLQYEAESRAIETEVFQAVFPVVGEAVKEYGLEENKDDPPLIAGLKEAGRELLYSNVDPVFMQDEENAKAVSRVKHWSGKREKDNALREVDPLKVRTRSAAEKIRQMPKLDAILSAIKILSESKAEKIKDRGKGQPPVPAGAPPGGSAVPKTEIRSWDDAFAAAGQ